MVRKRNIFIKDILLTISKSKGRFLSLVFLMALGAFALIGLKVTVPNMYQTAQRYFENYQTADLMVLATHGIDENDVAILSSISSKAAIEYGYLQDVGIKDTVSSMRLFSKSETISQYEVVEGRLPEQPNEIAIASAQKEKYKLSDVIEIEPNDMLTDQKFKIVGFVNSTELLSKIDLGQTNIKTGTLTMYGVIVPSAFKQQNIYSLARIKFHQIALDYTKQYVDQIFSYKKEVENLLINQSQQRYMTLVNQIGKEQVDRLYHMTLPKYTVYTKRDWPGSTGYKTYESNAQVIDSVGNTFPVVLYLVAALVTFTTMTRFVDEERMIIGTFKALGFSNVRIMMKFVVYGWLASTIGTTIGVISGHTILPMIINTTYASSVTFPNLSLNFYPILTIIAFILAYTSAVLPAFLVVKNTVKEKTASLLRPKVQIKGTKILLEKISFIWKKLKFSQKVTARNIFRYKKRMLMTIFGVAGSVALLFTGLGIQSSVSNVARQQFEHIMKYDLVVSTYFIDSNEITSQFQKWDITQYTPIYYEELTTIAGKNNDQQSISFIALNQQVNQYISLVDANSGEEIYPSNQGVIISKKLADLLNAKKGSQISFTKENNNTVSFIVEGICEMYMGHFIFAAQNNDEYNAYLVNLNNKVDSVDHLTNELMSLKSVKGISQNSIYKKQIDTIVNSLNKVMAVLIIASMLLGAVILYNLIHVNVSERVRELSTIKVLGFYPNEVTRYIYREIVYLSLIGIIVGFMGGKILHQYIMNILPPDHIFFSTSVDLYVYGIPVLMIVILLAILYSVVHHFLKKVNMLEALKSIE